MRDIYPSGGEIDHIGRGRAAGRLDKRTQTHETKMLEGMDGWCWIYSGPTRTSGERAWGRANCCPAQVLLKEGLHQVLSGRRLRATSASGRQRAHAGKAAAASYQRAGIMPVPDRCTAEPDRDMSGAVLEGRLGT